MEFKFDVQALRDQFPACKLEINGTPIAYLDGPGGTQVPQCVLDAITGYLINDNANEDGNFRASTKQRDIEIAARQAAADFLGGSTTAVLAYAQDFPDGLSGGPVAMSMKSPLLLVDRSGYADARAYAKKAGIKKALTMGGPALIPDSVVKTILNY